MSGGDAGRRLVLGIDLGSSSAKAVLADETGEIVAQAQVPQRVRRPVPGAAEQSPDDWWDAVLELVAGTWRAAAGSQPGRTLAGLSVSGHCPTLLLADADGEALAPAMLYGDTRADGQVDAAARLAGESLAGDEWLPKLLWLAREQPGHLSRTAMVCNPHDHVAYRLTGLRALDHRSARRSGGLLDPTHLAWRGDLARSIGLAPSALPPLRRAGGILGPITPDAAADTGLPPGTPVVVGMYDTPAELIGAGVARPGEVLLYYGTTTSADVCTHDFEAYLRDPSPIADWAPYREVAYAVLGPALRWVAGGIEPQGPGSMVPDSVLRELDAAAAAITPTLDDPFVVPHFLAHARPGEPVRKPAIVGLDADDSRVDLHRAVLEAYGFSVRAGLEVAGLGASQLRFVATGGGARSEVWRQLVSDVVGVEQAWRPRADAALGSAALAAWATCGSPVFAAAGWGVAQDEVLTAPDPDRHRVETDRYRHWLRIRDALATATNPQPEV